MEQLSVLAETIAARLKQRGETIAIAESSAGGLISAALLAVPGASAYFQGGAVVYTRQARKLLLGIEDQAVRTIRSASEPYATLLATTVKTRFATSWGLSETGATGPTGNRYGDAAGHVCLAVSGPVDRIVTIETGSADRAANMQTFAASALRLLADALDAAP